MPRLLWLVVWPYHMTFRHSTLDPISGIARASTFKEKKDVVEAMNLWRTAKEEELQFIKVAVRLPYCYQCSIVSDTSLKSTVSAAAVIGVFSWPAIEDGYWLATGLWHCSLLLSIWAGISSAQQGWLLVRMPPLQAESASQADLRLVLRSVLRQAVDGSLPVCDLSGHVSGKEKIDWNMVYIWQVPIMLMSYAWATFFLALTLHICTPLIEGGEWGRDHKVSVMTLSSSRY
jgi:hypothetical protein